MNIVGKGTISCNGEYVCTVTYEVRIKEPGDRRGSISGIITVKDNEVSKVHVLQALSGQEPLVLELERPLPTGHEQLPVNVNAIGGHQIGGRYRFTLRAT